MTSLFERIKVDITWMRSFRGIKLRKKNEVIKILLTFLLEE